MHCWSTAGDLGIGLLEPVARCIIRSCMPSPIHSPPETLLTTAHTHQVAMAQDDATAADGPPLPAACFIGDTEVSVSLFLCVYACVAGLVGSPKRSAPGQLL